MLRMEKEPFQLFLSECVVSRVVLAVPGNRGTKERQEGQRFWGHRGRSYRAVTRGPPA